MECKTDGKTRKLKAARCPQNNQILRIKTEPFVTKADALVYCTLQYLYTRVLFTYILPRKQFTVGTMIGQVAGAQVQ